MPLTRTLIAPKRLLPLPLLIWCATGAAQLTDGERKGLADALYVGNLALEDLASVRKSSATGFGIPLVREAMNRPVEAAATLMALHGGAAEPLSSIVRHSRSSVLGDPEAPIAIPQTTPTDLSGDLPGPLRSPIGELAQAVKEANSIVRTALEALLAEERRALLEGLPQVAAPGLRFEFAQASPPVRSDLVPLLQKVDLVAIRFAAERLAIRIEAALAELRTQAALSNFSGTVRFLIDGMPVVVAGKADDVHTDRGAVLTVDLGGDDRYLGRHGAGPGYASVHIDLGGSDRYDVPDLGLGAGLLGIGVAMDFGGNDSFRGKSIGCGVGIAGVGLFLKEGGDDDYSAASMAQGFGFFGIGVSVDTGGNDRYRSSDLSQGCALTQGVGWLIDRLGDDSYSAIGRLPHTPAIGGKRRAHSQGSGSGFTDADAMDGGVGLLTELAGDDVYIAGTHAQGASLPFSLGSLYDRSGEDTYRAGHAAQASATGGAAYLFEMAGDDVYLVSLGHCHGSGAQGGVALLLDREGSDQYTATDSRPGLGHGGGLGVFVDSAGRDAYVGPPGVGVAHRSMSSLGLFVDLAGSDRYAEGLADGNAARGEAWGFAFDRGAGTRREPADDSPRRVDPPPGSAPRPGDDELKRVYLVATGDPSLASVRDAISRLIAIGEPAMEWMLGNRLRGATEAEVALFARVAGVLGASAKKMIAERISSQDEELARRALEICAEGPFAEASPLVKSAMGRPGLVAAAARVAAALKLREVVPELMLATASPDRLAAAEAMRALAAIGDAQSVSTAEALVTSADIAMRRAAFAHIAAFPERAASAGSLLSGESDERRARVGIELLGASGSDESLRAIARFLDDGRPGVRIEAMLALHGRCPKEFQRRLVEMRRDPVEIVRSVAQRIDPGR